MEKLSKNSKDKVVVAMSGGVDSSVAAALLNKQGYEVIGVFMQFWFPTGEKYGENRCCSLESWHEACEVARILDIPIHKVNFGREFKKLIVDEFLKEYRAGHTPNPCVACNKFVKFDLLLKYARTVFGANYLATGHYVSIKDYGLRNKKGRRRSGLEVAKDKNKDQTYFLYNLKQPQLKHLLFPLGEMKKEQVRKLARALKLPIHDKKDSQEVCFVGASHGEFLKKYLKPKAGDIVDERGQAIGRHQGLPLYTLGQRSGIGLSGGPWYVCGFDRRGNRLIVTRNQHASDIFKKELKCNQANWVVGVPAFPLKCQARIRYGGKLSSCTVEKSGRGLVVKFRKSQRGISPGQSIVFYEKDTLLGGGIIR